MKTNVSNRDLEKIEKKYREENNNKRLLVIVLSITTIIIAMVGASFAWFTATVKNVNGNQSIKITTAVLEGVTFQASDNLAIINALPGDSTETTFTITNPNASANARYSLKFVTDVNDFTNEAGDNQLVVTITGGDIVTPIVLDFTNGEMKEDKQIITNIELNPKESDVYHALLEFRNIDSNQISNQEKTFVGHIEITQSIAVQ